MVTDLITFHPTLLEGGLRLPEWLPAGRGLSSCDLLTSRHRHENFRGAAIRGDLMDRDRVGSGPRHARQVSRHTRNGNADNLRSLRQELVDRINRYVADHDIAIDE